MRHSWVKLNIFFLLFFVLFSIARADPIEEEDPYEEFNRIMFSFNEHIDHYILKPLAEFYNKVIPKPLNKGIKNIFNNLENLPMIANDILQLNLRQTLNDGWRFGINSTIGIGGLFDVAERIDLKPRANDFGLTLAKWGYKKSNYLVLPFWGPYTVRDGLVGLPVDYLYFSIYPYIEPPKTRYAIYYGLDPISARAQLLKFEDVLEEAAFDKYVFVRNAYLQRRRVEINQITGVEGE